ncbi:uncharacterized protein [Euwallacea fornicatus]|uniref:uncharacterized protein isoform X2 n=1 Tax=Euwallacea fornicatus TaxID=995702 RepID=UPI00338F769C
MSDSLTIKLSHYASHCRLCLKANLKDDFRDIGSLTAPGHDVSLRRILVSLCKVTLHGYPSLSHYVCSTCFTAIERMTLFIRDVAHNQHYLLNLLNSTPESTKNIFEKNEGVNTKLASHSDTEINNIAENIVRKITKNSNKHTNTQRELENDHLNETSVKENLHSHKNIEIQKNQKPSKWAKQQFSLKELIDLKTSLPMSRTRSNRFLESKHDGNIMQKHSHAVTSNASLNNTWLKRGKVTPKSNGFFKLILGGAKSSSRNGKSVPLLCDKYTKLSKIKTVTKHKGSENCYLFNSDKQNTAIAKRRAKNECSTQKKLAQPVNIKGKKSPVLGILNKTHPPKAYQAQINKSPYLLSSSKTFKNNASTLYFSDLHLNKGLGTPKDNIHLKRSKRLENKLRNKDFDVKSSSQYPVKKTVNVQSKNNALIGKKAIKQELENISDTFGPLSIKALNGGTRFVSLEEFFKNTNILNNQTYKPIGTIPNVTVGEDSEMSVSFPTSRNFAQIDSRFVNSKTLDVKCKILPDSRIGKSKRKNSTPLKYSPSNRLMRAKQFYLLKYLVAFDNFK